MKAKLVPIYFKNADDPDFSTQLMKLRELLADEADILEPVKLGADLPDTDGVIFPEMLGQAYREVEKIRKLPQPLMIVTSEFGTVSMWDWEINSYLTAKGIKVIGPTDLENTRKVCRAFALRRQLKRSKLLVFQDNPANGSGNQDDIFKRFYWWEPECIEALEEKYGICVVKKSFKKLAEDARAIPDEQAQVVWDGAQSEYAGRKPDQPGHSERGQDLHGGKKELDQDPDILAVGINCLNESMFSETTPCLAWNFLFEDQRMVWGCEADLVSMLTKVLIHKTIDVPFMMTNLYPFQMGNAALKHEHIPYFPEIDGRSK